MAILFNIRVNTTIDVNWMTLGDTLKELHMKYFDEHEPTYVTWSNTFDYGKVMESLEEGIDVIVLHSHYWCEPLHSKLIPGHIVYDLDCHDCYTHKEVIDEFLSLMDKVDMYYEWPNGDPNNPLWNAPTRHKGLKDIGIKFYRLTSPKNYPTFLIYVNGVFQTGKSFDHGRPTIPCIDRKLVETLDKLEEQKKKGEWDIQPISRNEYVQFTGDDRL